MFKYIRNFTLISLLVFFSINSANALELKLPKLGKSSSNGMSLDDTKT